MTVLPSDDWVASRGGGLGYLNQEYDNLTQKRFGMSTVGSFLFLFFMIYLLLNLHNTFVINSTMFLYMLIYVS